MFALHNKLVIFMSTILLVILSACANENNEEELFSQGCEILAEDVKHFVAHRAYSDEILFTDYIDPEGKPDLYNTIWNSAIILAGGGDIDENVRVFIENSLAEILENGNYDLFGEYFYALNISGYGNVDFIDVHKVIDSDASTINKLKIISSLSESQYADNKNTIEKYLINIIDISQLSSEEILLINNLLGEELESVSRFDGGSLEVDNIHFVWMHNKNFNLDEKYLNQLIQNSKSIQIMKNGWYGYKNYDSPDSQITFYVSSLIDEYLIDFSGGKLKFGWGINSVPNSGATVRFIFSLNSCGSTGNHLNIVESFQYVTPLEKSYLKANDYKVPLTSGDIEFFVDRGDVIGASRVASAGFREGNYVKLEKPIFIDLSANKDESQLALYLRSLVMLKKYNYIDYDMDLFNDLVKKNEESSNIFTYLVRDSSQIDIDEYYNENGVLCVEAKEERKSCKSSSTVYYSLPFYSGNSINMKNFIW